MEKLIKNKLGQWSLKKGAPALPPEPEVNNIENEVGNTHTVEIHPAIDHLYNIKGMIQKDPRGRIKISDLKRNPMFNQMARAKRGSPNFIPRDGDGWVTADAIDNHIAALPKHKVNISVLPYTWGSQQHRNYLGKGQFVLSMQLHPDTLENMDEPTKKAWGVIGPSQHGFRSSKEIADKNDPQFGWARIDPYRTVPEKRDPNARWESNARNIVVSNPGHWHVDEIQSDFQNKDKIDRSVAESDNIYSRIQEEEFNIYGKVSDWLADPNNANHPAYDALKQAKDKMDEKNTNYLIHRAPIVDLGDAIKKYGLFGYKDRTDSERQKTANDILKAISHGHDDPQHAIQSAVNALARRLGIGSISMDTPADQAVQSNLRTNPNFSYDRAVEDYMNFLKQNPKIVKETLDPEKKALLDGSHSAFANPNFKTAVGKIGMDKLKDFLNLLGEGRDYFDVLDQDGEIEKKGLTTPETDAIKDYLRNIGGNIFSKWKNTPTSEKEASILSALRRPIHQVLTYEKRPKRLGMKRVPKASVLGRYSDFEPSDAEVQHMLLYKAKLLKSMLLAKAKDIKSESLRKEIEQLDLESLAELIN